MNIFVSVNINTKKTKHTHLILNSVFRHNSDEVFFFCPMNSMNSIVVTDPVTTIDSVSCCLLLEVLLESVQLRCSIFFSLLLEPPHPPPSWGVWGGGSVGGGKYKTSQMIASVFQWTTTTMSSYDVSTWMKTS